MGCESSRILIDIPDNNTSLIVTVIYNDNTVSVGPISLTRELIEGLLIDFNKIQSISKSTFCRREVDKLVKQNKQCSINVYRGQIMFNTPASALQLNRELSTHLLMRLYAIKDDINNDVAPPSPFPFSHP